MLATSAVSLKKAVNDPVDDLKSAILALGGGDDDYALVKDLESDDTQEFSDHEANVCCSSVCASLMVLLM